MPLPDDDNDVMLLQDAIMKEVGLKHQSERDLLMAVSLTFSLDVNCVVLRSDRCQQNCLTFS